MIMFLPEKPSTTTRCWTVCGGAYRRHGLLLPTPTEVKGVHLTKQVLNNYTTHGTRNEKKGGGVGMSRGGWGVHQCCNDI